MTAAQRRTVTVTIGGSEHQVQITADVKEPDELVKLAEVTFQSTRPQPRMGVGFGAQYIERRGDRNPAGSPVYHYGGPTEARHHD